MADEPTQYAYPMRLDADGDFVELTQDDLPEVEQSYFILMRTPLGIRPLAPSIGVEDLTFTNPDLDALAATLEDQDDRGVLTITAEPSTTPGDLDLQVQVALAADQQVQT